MKNRMEIVKRQQPQETPTLWSVIVRNRYLVILAIAGIVFATWQYLKR